MSDNYKKVKLILSIILLCNLLVALLKIVIGSAIRSTSLVSDGYHSMADGASNIAGLIGIWLADKPTDEKFPYGRYKIEIMSGLFIGAMLLYMAVKVVLEALSSFANPVTPNITVPSLIALVVTLIINIVISKYEYSAGKKLNSHILISDSLHTKSDIYISIGVLVALIGVKLGLPPVIDPLVSLVVAGFIVHSSYEIFKSTIDILIDRSALDEKVIADVLNEFKEIKTYHNIRSRGNQNNIHIDMHVMVDSHMSVEEAHELSHSIEDRLRELTNENTQTIVHIEPYYERL